MEKAEEEARILSRVMADHGVPDRGRVLDLGCGIGRHSIPLAKRGYQVVGVDLSPDFTHRARDYADAEGVSESASFHVGDMRHIAASLEALERVDATINMWTALGYYGEEVDRDVLRQVAGITTDTGLLLVEMGNKDGILRVFQAQGWDAAGDLVQLATRRFEPERSYMVNDWVFYRRVGDDLKFVARERVDHRFYNSAELEELAESAGWAVEGVYGGMGLEPVDHESPGTRMLLVARKGGGETTEEG